MNQMVYDKPLTAKDFLKEKSKTTAKKSKFYEKVRKLPESPVRKGQSKYWELVNAIAQERKGTYKVLLAAIKADLSPRSAYSSIEKTLVQIAQRNGVNFNTAIRRQVQTKKGPAMRTSYPEYIKWKEENIKLRVVGNELFIEKKTDKTL
jgi:hypothetical protein